MFGLPVALLIRVGAAAALLAALTAGYFAFTGHHQNIGERRASARYDKALTEQRDKAAAALAQATDQVRAVERALQDSRNQLEITDAKHQATIADLSRRVRVAAGPAGRLRDPHASAECGRSGDDPPATVAAPADDRAADRADAGGLLSEPLTRLLSELTEQADRINAAYASCRADAVAVRVACSAPPGAD